MTYTKGSFTYLSLNVIKWRFKNSTRADDGVTDLIFIIRFYWSRSSLVIQGWNFSRYAAPDMVDQPTGALRTGDKMHIFGVIFSMHQILHKVSIHCPDLKSITAYGNFVVGRPGVTTISTLDHNLVISDPSATWTKCHIHPYQIPRQ